MQASHFTSIRRFQDFGPRKNIITTSTEMEDLNWNVRYIMISILCKCHLHWLTVLLGTRALCQRGVKISLDILKSVLICDMRLAGTTSIEENTSDFITRR
jgi:hypothetical protein